MKSSYKKSGSGKNGLDFIKKYAIGEEGLRKYLHIDKAKAMSILEEFIAFDDRPEHLRRGQKRPKLKDHVAELGLLKFERFLAERYEGKVKAGTKMILARLLLREVTVTLDSFPTNKRDLEGTKYIAGAEMIPVTYLRSPVKGQALLTDVTGTEYKMQFVQYGEYWYLLPEDFNTECVPS